MEQLTAPAPAPADGQWTAEALIRVLDSTDPDMITEALQGSSNGQVAVNGLTVTLIQSVASLFTGVAMAAAAATKLLQHAEAIQDWLDGLEDSIDALLRFDFDPIIKQIQQLIDEAPTIIAELTTLANGLGTTIEQIVKDARAIEIPETIPDSAKKALEAAILEGQVLAETLTKGISNGSQRR